MRNSIQERQRTTWIPPRFCRGDHHCPPPLVGEGRWRRPIHRKCAFTQFGFIAPRRKSKKQKKNVDFGPYFKRQFWVGGDIIVRRLIQKKVQKVNEMYGDTGVYGMLYVCCCRCNLFLLMRTFGWVFVSWYHIINVMNEALWWDVFYAK